MKYGYKKRSMREIGRVLNFLQLPFCFLETIYLGSRLTKGWEVLIILKQKTFKKVLVNSLPNNKVLDWSKLKAFADDKMNVINPFLNDKF